MNKLFYPKLAATNIKKNGKIYLPYILTCIFTVAMFYIICSLYKNKGLEGMRGANTLITTLGFGVWVTAIFAVIFLFYTNSFLMKRRKKEFGLYNILGMEKKHISKVVFWETVYIALFSLAFGLICGMVLDKLMYLLVSYMLDIEVTLNFYVSGYALTATLLLFCAIFLLIFLNSMRQIHLAKPVELLKGGNVGEKEPKTKWILAILGFGCLIAAYTISITVENPVAAMSYFFIAVILVIIGTYMVFTAGSIAILKLLRKNKAYYYKPRHFISVSGLLYRMKQNAVGLSNICILSTMVLVMISSTVSLWIGMDDILNSIYPKDINITLREVTPQNCEKVKRIVAENLLEKNLEVQNLQNFSYLSFSAYRDGSNFKVAEDSDVMTSVSSNNFIILNFLTAEDYNRLTGQSAVLDTDEVIVLSPDREYTSDTLTVFDKTFQVTSALDGEEIGSQSAFDTYDVVVQNAQVLATLSDLQTQNYGELATDIYYEYRFDLDTDAQTEIAVHRAIADDLTDTDMGVYIQSRENSKSDFLGSYGGLFFIGLFLSVLFTMATILIIYYKQISEGYDDQERFQIMQKVGLSKKETRKTIHSQILTVFFLPLVTAGVHIAFAFPVIARLLRLFNLSNTMLYAVCTLASFLLFALLYAVIYSLTAKAYYKIVSSKS